MWWEQGFGLSLCPSPCLLPPLRFGKQGSATNPGHGHCSAPLAMAMPGALPACSPPLPALPPAFCAGKSGNPLTHFRSAFFCSTSGQRLAFDLAFALLASACIAPPLVASLRRASLAFARLGQARLGLQFRKKKPRSIPAPQPLPAVLRLACCLRYASASKARPVPGGTPQITHSVSKLIRLLAEYIGKPWPASALSSLRCGQSVRNGQGYGRKLGTVLATLRAEPRQRPYKALARRLHIWPTARASGRSSAQEQKLQTF